MVRLSVAATVLVSMLVLASGALGAPAQSGNYGPCCPLVKGQKAPTARPSAQGTLVGPQHACVTKQVTVVFAGAAHPVQMQEVNGSLLCPVRMMGLTGACVCWEGNRRMTVSRGALSAGLTMGSHAVKVEDGGAMRVASWALCPRLLNGVAYAPLRALAEALGLKVGFENGVVTLAEPAASEATAPAPVAPAVPAAPAAGSCPADRVEAALGVAVVRSPAASAFGTGVGITEVRAGGLAESLGLQAKDVVISCNEKPVRCPMDLDSILTELDAGGGMIETLVVARGQEKLTLQAP